MPDIVQVRFHEDTLHCIREEQDVWVVLNRACEVLGLASNGQLERLQRQPWATTRVIRVVGIDGRNREHLCLHLRSLAAWLSGVETGRVRPALRDKLVRFQCEAADVLYRHFFGGAPQLDIQIAIQTALAPLQERLDSLDTRVDNLAGRQDRTEANIESISESVAKFINEVNYQTGIISTQEAKEILAMHANLARLDRLLQPNRSSRSIAARIWSEIHRSFRVRSYGDLRKCDMPKARSWFQDRIFQAEQAVSERRTRTSLERVLDSIPADATDDDATH